MMRKQSGFSLLEVLIAGSVMILIAFAVQQLLASTSKGAGDLEKRLRYRDLVEDIRFQFLSGGLCAASLPRGPFQENAELRLSVGRDAIVAKDAVLSDYGLKVTRLYLENVQRLPDSTHTLTTPDGQYLGEYRETGEAADLRLEAQLLGSNHALKPITVVRVARVHRAGSINEDLCFGNHEVPGRSGAGAGSGGGAAADSSGQGDASDSPAAATGSGSGGGRPPKGGAYAPAAECFLKDAEAKSATGRNRLIDGETVKFSRFPGQVTYLKCVGGQLEESTKSQ